MTLTSLFFIWGLATSLNDILLPHLKAEFSLNYVQAALIQFCFFFAYFLASYPAGYLLEKTGYKTSMVIGLAMAALGCLAFYPAAAWRSYPVFLGALFVLACGITLLQVAANPCVNVLGPSQTAASRLTLAQAFNSLGAAAGPYLGAVFILSAADAGVGAVQRPYLGLALIFVLCAILIGTSSVPRTVPDASEDIGEARADDDAPASSNDEPSRPHSVFGYRHLVLGVGGIFVYTGAEVAIGSFLINLLEQPQIAGLSAGVAGKYLALYWSGALIGRIVGGLLMRKVRPGRMLAFNGLVNALLAGGAVLLGGHAAMWMLIAIGLFNSIMFPTIFSLALHGLGRLTQQGSGMLCMAIVGAALVPLAQGALADSIGLLNSFCVPVLCYLYILFYGLRGSRPTRWLGWQHAPRRRSASDL